MKIVKYECGCIGFEPVADGVARLLQTCDEDCGPSIRRMDKPYRPLDEVVEQGQIDAWQRRLSNALLSQEVLGDLKAVLRRVLQ